MNISGVEKAFFGVRKSDGARIKMSRPSWDRQWYWSFGYLGNSLEHYHLSSYAQGRNIDMRDALLSDYDLAPHIAENLWQFCEQAKTIYILKEAYEVLHRGGAHYTTHALQDVVRDDFARILATEKLPKLLQKFWDDFARE